MPAMHHEIPRLCVAVDVGTTYTGVAWLERKDGPRKMSVISDWPGKDARNEDGEDKVPSVLSRTLSPDGSRKWGYLCDSDTPETEKWRYLKMFLDPRVLESGKTSGSFWAPKDMAEVHTLVGAYLTEIYKHIRRSIVGEHGLDTRTPWAEVSIEFIFSVPTTWQGQGILTDFLAIIRSAGFGESTNHEVVLGLTEAEAAAISYLHQSGTHLTLENGDAFLSVDSGGGTTDLGFVKVCSARPPAMEQMQTVRGIGVGSMMIDLAFQQLVQERLDKHPDPSAHFELPPNLSLKVSQSSSFMRIKHKVGDPGFIRAEYKIQMLGVRHNYSCRELGIANGCLILPKSEFERRFDDQLTGIAKLLEEALESYEKDETHEAVKYIILSGGLGSSQYILRRLGQHVQQSDRRCLQGTQVRMCREPQLVVVKGLLLEHTKGILRTRIARASYGVVVRQRYSAKRHFRPSAEVDECDDEIYATEQINWIIKAGQKLVHDEPLFATITRNVRVDPNTPLTWLESIVWSGNPEGCLPRSMASHHVEKLYQVKADMSQVPADRLVVKKKRAKSSPWKIKFTYYVCKYDLHLTVGPSGDLRFSILHQGEPLPGSSAPEKVMIESKWDTSAGEEAKD